MKKPTKADRDTLLRHLHRLDERESVLRVKYGDAMTGTPRNADKRLADALRKVLAYLQECAP